MELGIRSSASRSIFICVLGFCFGAANSCSHPVRTLPALTIADVQLHGRKLSFSLTNNGQLRITACTLEFHGARGRTPFVRWTIDWYNSAEGAEGPLQPRRSTGASISAPKDFDARSPGAISIVAIVFDDTSSSGNQADIDAIFRRRTEERHVLSILTNEYATALELPVSVTATGFGPLLSTMSEGRRLRALMQMQSILSTSITTPQPALIEDLRKAFAAATVNNNSDVRAAQRLWRLHQAAIRHTRKEQ